MRQTEWEKIYLDQGSRPHIEIIQINFGIAAAFLFDAVLSWDSAAWCPGLGFFLILALNAGLLFYERGERKEAIARDKENARIDAVLAAHDPEPLP